MAKDRITPCKFYICYGECEKKRDADIFGYCQTCDKYQPRAKIKYKNHKKEKLDKYRREYN
jgi:hypothetical protein